MLRFSYSIIGLRFLIPCDKNLLNGIGSIAMIEIKKKGDLFIVKPDTDVVASMAADFRSKLQGLIQESPKTLEIDLGGVEMVDSVGIGIIIATHNSLSKSGGKLRVTNIADAIFTLFTTMRLDHHFTIEKKESDQLR